MGKTIVRNKLANKTKTFTLPCEDTVATTFCTDFLEGEFEVLAFKSESGTDTQEAYHDVSVMVKNQAGTKAYLNMAVKATLTEDEIYTALAGGTFNGVKADEMAIIKLETVSA